MQPSASNTDLLFNCQRPYAVEVDRGAETEAMRYGNAFHYHADNFLSVGCSDPPIAGADTGGVDLLAYHAAEAAMATLRTWLRGGNPFGYRFSVEYTERHLASYISRKGRKWNVSSRVCDFDASTHTYALEPGEFGGTPDLVARCRRARLVLDHKTGDYGAFDRPAQLPQLLTLALQTGATHVGVLHAPRNAPVVIYAEEVDIDALQAHASHLKGALGRIGDGSMRPGEWCARCPARNGCPTQDGHLVATASSLAMAILGAQDLVSRVDKGTFHMLLGDLDRLSKRARELLREAVRSGEIISRPDGKVLVMREKTVESLSKESCIRALGASKAEELFASLRESGCLQATIREEMHAVSE